MRRLISFLCLTLLPSLVFAQDRAGRDTPGEWVVTHYQPFGLWDSICDERTTGDLREERCYLRYVEVYSPHPNFGAVFVFVTPDGVDIGLERGTRFPEDGMRIEKDGTTLWQAEKRACLRGRDCSFQADEADTLLDHMSAGQTLRLQFTDSNGIARDLTWDLAPFGPALADFRQNAGQRGLI